MRIERVCIHPILTLLVPKPLAIPVGPSEPVAVDLLPVALARCARRRRPRGQGPLGQSAFSGAFSLPAVEAVDFACHQQIAIVGGGFQGVRRRKVPLAQLTWADPMLRAVAPTPLHASAAALTSITITCTSFRLQCRSKPLLWPPCTLRSRHHGPQAQRSSPPRSSRGAAAARTAARTCWRQGEGGPPPLWLSVLHQQPAASGCRLQFLRSALLRAPNTSYMNTSYMNTHPLKLISSHRFVFPACRRSAGSWCSGGGATPWRRRCRLRRRQRPRTMWTLWRPWAGSSTTPGEAAQRAALGVDARKLLASCPRAESADPPSPCHAMPSDRRACPGTPPAGSTAAWHWARRPAATPSCSTTSMTRGWCPSCWPGCSWRCWGWPSTSTARSRCGRQPGSSA